jgi:hypothetical protein
VLLATPHRCRSGVALPGGAEPVVVDMVDSQSSGPVAAALTADFIDSGYVFILGPFGTDATHAVQAVTEPASTPERPILLVAPAASEYGRRRIQGRAAGDTAGAG